MSFETEFAIYVAIGLVMAVFGVWFFHKPYCASRKEALLEGAAITILGPAVCAGCVISSPLWLPMWAYGEYVTGSKFERAAAAWWNKPICKKSV